MSFTWVHFRGVSRGVSQVYRNQSGLLIMNWHNIPIHSNKTVKVYEKHSNKAVVTLLITFHLPLFTRGGSRGVSELS